VTTATASVPGIESRAIVLTEIDVMAGAERSVLALSRWMYQHGLEHHFVAYRDDLGFPSYADHPVTVVQLRPELRATKKVAALRKYFAARAQGPRPLTSGYQPALHATLAGVKGFHCLMHDTPSLFDAAGSAGLKQRALRYVSNRMIGRGLRSGGKTIVTSEFLREDCRRVFGVEAAIARMGGLSGTEGFHARRVEGELRLLSVSRIEGNKRIDWILHALAELERGEHPLSECVNWRLDVCGRGAQLEAMVAMAAELGLAERVAFLGYVSDAELENLYGEAHLFLMPAVQGYGIPAVEALTRGLPVLLHRESGVSDILLDTPWATVIEGGEEGMLPGLRRAITGVIEGRQLTASLPELPTEDGWAELVVRLCGWM
jgi:glycosyltransferase involved in cell wall biosynthesis